MNYYYIGADNEVTGPVDEEELANLYRKGVISEETSIATEGAEAWRPYASLVKWTPAPLAVRKSKTPEIKTVEAKVVKKAHKCPFCQEEIQADAKKCRHCNEFLDPVLRAAAQTQGGGMTIRQEVVVNNGPRIVATGNRKSGIVAAFLNMLLPGLGYMYCGRFILGLFVFVVTLAFLAATAGAAAIVLWPIFIIDGFLAASRANQKLMIVG